MNVTLIISCNSLDPQSSSTTFSGSWDASSSVALSSGASSTLPSPVPSATSTLSTNYPPVPFDTPPKLRSVEEVMRENTGTSEMHLRSLTTALAREAIFGREELAKRSLSGRKNTVALDKKKTDYIKALVRSRVPNKSSVEFEYIWKQCRESLSKSCQTLRTNKKKRQ